MPRNGSLLLSILLVATFAPACAGNTSPRFTRVSAAPQVVAAGGRIQVSAAATDPDGDALKYAWTVSKGWTLVSGGDGAAVVKAPSTPGDEGLVGVTVTDGRGGTAKASIAVSTDDTSPVISAVTSTPSPAVRGTPVTLSAATQDPDGDALTYAWSIVAAPGASTASLSDATAAKPTFTPDVAGTYTMELVVTDSPGGHASAPFDYQVRVENGAPTAVIAGTSPMAAVMNTPLPLDGTGSSSPAGGALAFAWSVTSGPAGATAAVSPAADEGKATFTADTAGSYTVGLQVTNDSGRSAVAVMAITVAGPAQLVVASGDAQTATVGKNLGAPVVVQAVTADGSPVPGLTVDWYPAGGTLLTPAATTTDAAGNARAVLRTSRIAGPGSVTAVVRTMPALTQTAGFSAAAGPAKSIALSMSTGNADTGATVSVRPVDEFGNPTDPGPYGQGQAFLLYMSGAGVFAGTATDGTLVSGGGTDLVVGQLAAGVFDIAFTDPVAETVTVRIQHAAGRPAALPYSAWAEDFEDDAEVGVGSWTTPSQQVSSWQVASGAGNVHGGSQSFGIDLTAADTALAGTSHLEHSFTVPSTPMAKLTWWQAVSVKAASDPAANCSAHPDFFVSARQCAPLGCSSMGLAPRAGYAATGSCSGRPGFGTTQQWEARQVDVTDALQTGYGYLDFAMANTPGAVTPPPGSHWYVDDVRLVHLTAAGDIASTQTVIRPGAAAEVDWTQPSYDSGAFYNQCRNDLAHVTVAATIIDANGNQTRDSQTVIDFGWGGSAAPVAVDTGTLVTFGANDAQVQFDQGAASLVLSDATNETVPLTLTDPGATGVTMGANATAALGPFVCHDSGLGTQWSDDIPVATYDGTEARRACQAYARQPCVAGTNSAYRDIVGLCYSAFQWTFVTATLTDACTNNPLPMSAGDVSATEWLPPGTGPSSPFCIAFPPVCANAQPGGSFTINPFGQLRIGSWQ